MGRRRPPLRDRTPAEVQPRSRVDAAFVQERATNTLFDPNLLVLRTPTAERGPPIIQDQGVVLGGNTRVAILRQVYDRGGETATRYKNVLGVRAQEFGLTPEQIDDFTNPVLVRRVKDGPTTTAAARSLADDLNRTATQARTSVEEATLASERLSDETLAFFDQRFGVDETLRNFLNTPEGVEFVTRLRDEGVFSAEQRNRFLVFRGAERNVVNPAGRDFVENVLLGKAIGSAEAIDQLPNAIRNKLLKAAPIIAGTRGRFDLQPALQEAARLLGEQGRSGTPLRAFLEQGGLGLGEAQFTGPGKQMAAFLSETRTQREVVEAFQAFRSASSASPAGQGELLPQAGRSPRQAFVQSFGDEFLGEAPGGATAEFAAEQPPAAPVTEPRKPKLELTPERIAALQERGITITPAKQAENLAGFRRRSEARRLKREERARGKAEGTRVQPGRGGKRRAGPPPPEGIPGPGESGGGRAGDESGNIDPPGEPGVAAGQRKREKAKLETKNKQDARRQALVEEKQRFDEARVDADDLADITKVRESIRGQLRAAAKAANIADELADDQLKDIARIQSNMLDVGAPSPGPSPGFLVGNSAGTGKTFVGAGVVAEVLSRAKDFGRQARVLLVLPGKADGPIVNQWADTARNVFDFEIKPFKPGVTPDDAPGVWTMSATGLGNQFDPNTVSGLKSRFGKFDLVVFDESHMFGNTFGANRARAARSLREGSAGAVLHLSATPFEFPWDLSYLENLRLWGPGRRVATFPEWLATHGIRKAKRSKHTYYFVKNTREDIMKTLVAIRRQMVEAGIYTQREIKVDKKLQNDFVEVKFDEVYGAYYQAVMTEINNLEAHASTGLEVMLLKSARVTFTRRISEVAKVPKAIELAREFVEDGRSVVLFTGYKMDFELAPKTAKRFPSLQAIVESIDERHREGINRIVRELGGEDAVGQVHGGRSGGQRQQDITNFQAGRIKVLTATASAGGTGLSLHDMLGDQPRVQINLTMPWTGKAVEQLAGRTYRVGTKTDTQMIWMGIDTPVERGMLGRVAMKMEAMGALVQGKVETDATKLAEFDFLPEAEIQQQVFGYKQELGLNPEETSLDFRGKKNEMRPNEAESSRRLDQAREDFLAATADEAKAPGLPVKGTHPPTDAVKSDLELPRPNRKILKHSQIVGIAARRFAVRTFLGGIRQKNVLGRFKIVADLVRIRSAQDIRTAAHEFGHHIDKLFFGFLSSPKDLTAKVPTHLLPFVDELKPMAYAGAKDAVTEGMAEFISEYVIRPKLAQEMAPKFFKYFRDHLNRVAPKDLDTLDWMQDQVRLFKTFPAAERIGSRVIIGDSGELDAMMPGRRFKKWYTGWLDHQTPFRDMDQIMMLEDRTWRSLQMLGRRTLGADPLAENMMLKGIMDFKDLDQNDKISRVSKGLKEIMAPIDSREKFDLFIYWTVARRATELQGRGLETGLEDLLKDGTVNDLQRQVAESDLSELFEKAWEELSLYQAALLKWLVDSENLTPKQALAMAEMNKMYVPWQRLLGEPDHLMDWVAEAKRTGGQSVDGVVGLPPPIHGFKGDTRPIINPIESIVGNTRFFTQLGFRKSVENQIAKFSNDVFGAEGHARFITAIDAPQVASRFNVGQIKQALGNLGIRLEDVDDDQLAELVTLFSPMNKTKDLPVFSAMIDGKRKWFQVNDPDTWDAVAGLNKVEFGWILNAAVTAKNVLRNGIVLSGEFMARNFIRDTQTAWIQTPARGKGAKGLARSIPMVAAVEGLAESLKAGKLWEEFLASGAGGSALTRVNRETNREYMRQMFGRKGVSRHLSATHSIPNNAREVYRMVKEISQGLMYNVNKAGSIIENANRLSTFRATREQGADFLSAGFAAANVSTDFRVHGSRLAAWRLTTAFLNPAAQGTARAFRAFKRRETMADFASRPNPLRTLARSSMLTFTSAALWWHNQQDPDYPEYNANLKSRYWIFKAGSAGTVYRIPKTYIYGDVFGSFLGEAFLDFAINKDPDIVRRLGIVLGQAFGFTMVPTLALPALEIALNRSLYFDTPISNANLKSRYWIFKAGSAGTVYRIPKTYIYGDVFGSFLGEAFLDFAINKDPDIVRRLGIVLGQAFGFTMVPTLALPALEIALNRSLYFDTPIERESERDPVFGIPKEFRSRNYTSESSKKLSLALARWSETLDTKGLGPLGKLLNRANFSPVQYDHLIRGYFGTLGFDLWNDIPFLIKLGRNCIRAIKDDEPLPYTPNERWRNHNVLRAFTIEFPSGSAESMRAFYERRELLNEIAGRYSMLMSLSETAGDDNSEEALAAVTYFENHMQEIMAAPLFQNVASKLAVHSRQKAVASDIEEIRQINRDALNIARDALADIGDLTPAEAKLMEQRIKERRFMRAEDRKLQGARDQLSLLVMRRQLQGFDAPTEGEADQVRALIRATPDLTGSQRGALRRFYNSIRKGSLVDQEFMKTPGPARRRFQQQERRNR